jgi:hypothetical protein
MAAPARTRGGAGLLKYAISRLALQYDSALLFDEFHHRRDLMRAGARLRLLRYIQLVS